MKALTVALGYDDAQTFLKQYVGVGDFTKERRELPEEPFDEYAARLLRLETEMQKAESGAH